MDAAYQAIRDEWHLACLEAQWAIEWVCAEISKLPRSSENAD